MSDHPAVPLTPAALAETAKACFAAGAGAMHFHVRDEQGGHSLDVERNRQAIAAIRDQVGEAPFLQVTTEAQGRFTPQQQALLIRELAPDGVSIALREILPEGTGDRGWETEVGSLFDWMASAGVAYQLIIYRPDELDRLERLRAEGIVPPAPVSLLFVLGTYDPPVPASPRDLLPFLAKVNSQDQWWIAAFGPDEGRCALTAASLGGHIRVGFENNVTLLSGDRAPDNASLVREVSAALKTIGLDTAGLDATRRLLENPANGS